MSTPPIVLVPGFWLGAWAWDDVAAALRADGHEVTALTLPGRESAETDRSSITLADHVDAIAEAVTEAGRPVVLAMHSGASVPGYGVTDRIPEQVAAVVYVDTAPATGAIDPEFDADEKPMPSLEDLAKHPVDDVRAAAAAALEPYAKEMQVRAALEQARTDAALGVRRAAQLALAPPALSE